MGTLFDRFAAAQRRKRLLLKKKFEFQDPK